jgi:hypothetical protein
MSIVSSSFVVDTHNQIDGRIYVKETHVDSAGGEHIVEYLANVGMDHAAICTARAEQINAVLAEAEADEILAG